MVTAVFVKIARPGTMGTAVPSILSPSTIMGCHTHKGLKHQPGRTVAELKDNSLVSEETGAGGLLPASFTPSTYPIKRQKGDVPP